MRLNINKRNMITVLRINLFLLIYLYISFLKLKWGLLISVNVSQPFLNFLPKKARLNTIKLMCLNLRMNIITYQNYVYCIST